MSVIEKARFNGNIIVTPHAAMRASELYGVNYGPDAKEIVENRLLKSTFVSYIVGENGKVDRLYAYRRVAFVLDETDNVVITLYYREDVDQELRTKVQTLIMEHMTELNEQEREIERELNEVRTLTEIQKELKRRNLVDDSDLIEINEQRIEKLERELYDFALEKSKVAKGIVAYL